MLYSSTWALLVSIIPTCFSISAFGICDSNQFECANGKCIPANWRCDNVYSCGGFDRSDETNCGTRSCTTLEFDCGGGSGCINRVWLCNGSEDCDNGADEDKTTCGRDSSPTWETRICTTLEFDCGPGSGCISRVWLCDGSNDCDNGADEDETACGRDGSPTWGELACPQDFFSCGLHDLCIPKSWVCDNKEDCFNGEDETSCARKFNTAVVFAFVLPALVIAMILIMLWYRKVIFKRRIQQRYLPPLPPTNVHHSTESDIYEEIQEEKEDPYYITPIASEERSETLENTTKGEVADQGHVNRPDVNENNQEENDEALDGKVLRVISEDDKSFDESELNQDQNSNATSQNDVMEVMENVVPVGLPESNENDQKQGENNLASEVKIIETVIETIAKDDGASATGDEVTPTSTDESPENGNLKQKIYRLPSDDDISFAIVDEENVNLKKKSTNVEGVMQSQTTEATIKSISVTDETNESLYSSSIICGPVPESKNEVLT